MRKTLVAGVVVLSVVLVLAGCDEAQQLAGLESEPDQPEAGDAHSTDGPDSTEGPDAASRPTPSQGGQPGADSEQHEGHNEPVNVPPDAQRHQVESTEFAFEPAELTIEAGRSVAVTLTNAGEVEHEWELIGDDGSAIAHAHAGVGDEATVVFTLDEPGTYEVRCTIPGHAEEGMIGKVTAT